MTIHRFPVRYQDARRARVVGIRMPPPDPLPAVALVDSLKCRISSAVSCNASEVRIALSAVTAITDCICAWDPNRGVSTDTSN
jgi:hypothetical protein